MNTSIKTDDVIFNFFKQICDEKNDQKCLELGSSWISAMEINLDNIEKNLDGADKLKHGDDIQSNRTHLNLNLLTIYLYYLSLLTSSLSI